MPTSQHNMPVATVAWVPLGSMNEAASRLRAYQVAEALREKYGINSVFPGMPMSRPPEVLVSQRFDQGTIRLAQQLRDCGTRTFLDLSANVWDPASLNYNYHQSWGRNGDWSITEALKTFHAVIAASPVLASSLAAVDPGIPHHVLRDCIDTSTFAPRSHSRGDRFLIGWFGVEHNLSHMRLVVPALRRLSASYSIGVRVVSNAMLYELPGLNVEFVPWNLDSYQDKLRDCDVLVLPMTIDAQNAVRSTNRLLVCMGLGVPAVISPLPAYLDIVNRHPGIALVADTDAEWYTHLERLLCDATLRNQMAEQGCRVVEAEFSIANECSHWRDVLFGSSRPG